MDAFSHLDEQNRPRMVDVSEKKVSYRVARASGFIKLEKKTLDLISENKIAKGSVLVTAELAGVQAAKETSRLIPLCHPLLLSSIKVKALVEENGVKVVSEVKCAERTGVEMEALAASSVALLTVYDMCKAVDKNMVISEVRLEEKTKKEISR